LTYNIIKGIPTLAGEGDLHDKAFNRFGHSVVLNDFNTAASDDAMIYTLTLYPSSFEQFRTKSPVAVALGFVVAVILASIVTFGLYDYFMRRESNKQKQVLDLKCRFIRFISHEIRTPLNTVCMGLELLKSDIQSYRPTNDTGERTASRFGLVQKTKIHSSVLLFRSVLSLLVPEPTNSFSIGNVVQHPQPALYPS
jgi:signal transduction histidine kinase